MFDTVVIGSGSAGAAVAARLVADTSDSVLLLEAGPDYGPHGSGRWPADLLDFRKLPESHQWGYDSADTLAGRVLPFDRARVIGGCSSHNGCAAIWGSRLDYDGWAGQGRAGWSADDLRPLFEDADRRLRVRRYREEEIPPFQRAWLDAAPALGIPLSADLNDLDEDVGIAPAPVNVVDGVRWNTAFAFLDEVRDSERLTVRGDAMVDRLRLEGDRIVGVEVVVGETTEVVGAGRVVLAAGAYGSPAVLQRSGIGHPEDLRAAGVAVAHERRGVGRGLQDHPAIVLGFAGTAELEDATRRFAETRPCPEEQVIAKARSRYCEEGFDLHLCPIGGFDPSGEGFFWSVMVANMTPLASGTVAIRSADPAAPPIIDNRFLSDPEGRDAAVLVDGIEIARRLTATPPLDGLLGPELEATAAAVEDGALDELVRNAYCHYYHPVGTCRMGLADDPAAVVDADGRAHGIEGLWVADCSIMPTVPRANTAVPAVVAGLRVAQALCREVA